MKIYTSLHILSAVSLMLAGVTFAQPVPNLVLGKPNFTPSLAITFDDTANTLNLPKSVAVDPISRKVFIADTKSNRILRYPSADALANGAAAELVIGQENFTDVASDFFGSINPTALNMKRPAGLFIDFKGRLWVADDGYNRVLMFENASSRSQGLAADKVLGHLNFITSNSAVFFSPPSISANTMSHPNAVWVDSGDRLWVSDAFNDRVLRFDNVTNKANGAAADGVLGQPNFTTSAAGSGATGFSEPLNVPALTGGIAVSPSGALFVSNGHRVLRFNNAASLPNGAPANAVFGQANFETQDLGLSATQMRVTGGLTINPDDSLWVADSLNGRALRFDSASTKPSGTPANAVLGQPNFTTNISDSSLLSPVSVFLDTTGSLWVVESFANRVIRFPSVGSITPPGGGGSNGSADQIKPTLAVGKVPKSTKKKSITITGTASDNVGVAKVQYRIGKGALITATGTASWTFKAKLKKGNNSVTINATDAAGNASLNRVVKVTKK